ncbi:Hydroxyacylglutathione hydrolase [Bienertia sinuspersici]
MNMAVPLLHSNLSSSPFQVKAFSTCPYLPQSKLTCAHHGTVSYTQSATKVIAQFGLPEKAKIQLKVVKEKLWKSLPDAVKEFPWKKAEDQVLQQLLDFGQEAFKWSFIAWFFLSFSLDVAVTISKNHEIFMPFGLIAGCLISDFMKETSEELFQQQELRGINRNFLGIACIFVVLKLVAASFAGQSWTFLLHMANGGLMQILWLWKKLQENVEVQR